LASSVEAGFEKVASKMEETEQNSKLRSENVLEKIEVI